MGISCFATDPYVHVTTMVTDATTHITKYPEYHADTMDDRKDITVPMPADLDRQIIEQLDYGDSKAAWIREAIRMRLRQERGDSDATSGNARRPMQTMA